MNTYTVILPGPPEVRNTFATRAAAEEYAEWARLCGIVAVIVPPRA